MKVRRVIEAAENIARSDNDLRLTVDRRISPPEASAAAERVLSAAAAKLQLSEFEESLL